MKVLNLRSVSHHQFEGCFASEGDFIKQDQGGLLHCPVCGAAEVHKMPSAPRLNLRAVRDAEGAPQPGSASVVPTNTENPGEEERRRQGQVLKAMRELIAQTEDVGDRFAEQARAMHHGERKHRNIRGQATPEVALELIEEGIDVVPLPLIPAAKEVLQ